MTLSFIEYVAISAALLWHTAALYTSDFPLTMGSMVIEVALNLTLPQCPLTYMDGHRRTPSWLH